MLTRTFIHVPGVGYTTETKLWRHGSLTWQDFLRAYPDLPLPRAKQDHIRAWLLESEAALAARDQAFFGRLLPRREHWRLFPEFSDSIVYLDIETTGLGSADVVTLVGLYDGADYRAYIRGIDLPEFPREVARFSLLVTYFGTCFDLPFLGQEFPGLRFGQSHIDLCYLLRRLGYTGGLKRVEEKLGIERSAETRGLSGYDAVRLWREYERGDRSALELLVRYNMEDVMNLEGLMNFAYRELCRQLGFCI